MSGFVILLIGTFNASLKAGYAYGHDAAGRITQVSASDSRILAQLPATGTYGAANKMNQVANVPGRTMPLTWSVQGNLLTDGRGNSFVHDALNRLTKVTKSDGSQIYHRYDPMGIRIETVRNFCLSCAVSKNRFPLFGAHGATGLEAAGDALGGDRTRYLTAKTEEIADLDQNRNIIRIYIPGAKRVWRECAKLRDQRKLIDERVAQMEADGAISYIHTDHQSSVIAITDSAGNPISRRNYGVYGETNSAQMTGASAGQSHPFGYTGRRYDADTGLYYYRARWYDPELGTFLETDPLGELDYINMYAYVGVNPLNATDPSGMECLENQRGPCWLSPAQLAQRNRGEPITAGAASSAAQRQQQPSRPPTSGWTDPVPGFTNLNRADRPREGSPVFGSPRGDHPHGGVDILAPEGTPVVAAHSGTVIKVVTVPDGNDGGLRVNVQTSEGFVFRNQHLQDGSIVVEEGQRVEAGQRIGSAGRTGNTPPRGDTHLHFEIVHPRRGRVDPCGFIRCGPQQ